MLEWSSKKGRMEDLDRSFDYEFWNAQSPSQRVGAAWQMVIDYHIGILGEDEDKLRLQRSLAVLKPREC